jgi:hypothetical protein
MLACPVARNQVKNIDNIDQKELKKAIFQARLLVPMKKYEKSFLKALHDHFKAERVAFTPDRIRIVFGDWEFTGTCRSKASILAPEFFMKCESKFTGYMAVAASIGERQEKILVTGLKGTIEGKRKILWTRKPKVKEVREKLQEKFEKNAE